MAYVITDECVSCGTCAGECPVEAIAEGDSHYETTRMYALSAEHAQAYVQPRLSQKSNLYGTYKKGSLSRSSFFLCIRFKTYREASSCRAFSFTIAFPCSSRNASAAREKDSCLPYSERMLQTLLNSSGLQPDWCRTS